MKMLKLSLVVLFYFQLSTSVLAQYNLTENAENALILLSDQIQSSSHVVSVVAPKLWSVYKKNISEALEKHSTDDVKEFRSVLTNIATAASNFSSTKQCLDVLLSSPGSNQNIFSAEELIVSNLLNLATVNILNSASQYAELNAEFVANCIENKRNCEGISKAVLTEVGRQLPLLKRLPYELLTEIHHIGFELEIHLENVRTTVWEIYHRAVQNITVCVVSKIKETKQITEPAPEVPGGIETAYEVLKYIVERATLTHTTTLITNSVRTQAILDNGSQEVLNLLTIAFDAIALFANTAADFNVSLNCSFSDMLPIMSASLVRASRETQTLVSGMQKQYDEAVAEIEVIGAEVQSIDLEIQACAGGNSCDYLLGKIASKQSEILWRMEQVESSALVIFQQTVTGVKQNGARIARNAAEQLEIGITEFKNCVNIL